MATAVESLAAQPTRQRRSLAKRRENLYGYLFLLPWLVGFFGLFIGPGLYSLYLSTTDYALLGAPRFVGTDNYVKMFTEDQLFWPSLGRTFYFAIVAVPLGVIGSMILAILLIMVCVG
jgi:multiple sugar transport system permease protein